MKTATGSLSKSEQQIPLVGMFFESMGTGGIIKELFYWKNKTNKNPKYP